MSLAPPTARSARRALCRTVRARCVPAALRWAFSLAARSRHARARAVLVQALPCRQLPEQFSRFGLHRVSHGPQPVAGRTDLVQRVPSGFLHKVRQGRCCWGLARAQLSRHHSQPNRPATVRCLPHRQHRQYHGRRRLPDVRGGNLPGVHPSSAVPRRRLLQILTTRMQASAGQSRCIACSQGTFLDQRCLSPLHPRERDGDSRALVQWPRRLRGLPRGPLPDAAGRHAVPGLPGGASAR